MSRKILLLILASIVGLAALSYIQAELIKNTYSLRKEAFIDNDPKQSDHCPLGVVIE